MKKIRYRTVGLLVLVGVELLARGMITGQQMVSTLGIVNVLFGVSLMGVWYMQHHEVHIPHLHHYRKAYGWTALVMVWIWFVLHWLLLGQGMHSVIVLTAGVVCSVMLTGKLLPLMRGKTHGNGWRVLGLVSIMIALIIFQKYWAVESEWLIVVAFGVSWFAYAVGMVVTDSMTLRDPLLITWGMLTIIAALRATSTVLIDAYEDRKIETIVYQDKEVYLPAEYCLPDRGTIRMGTVE